jgi:hypothetical protein
MKQMIGGAAQKEKFFPRPDIRAKLLDSIRRGENILFSGPRRTGKTSQLLDLVNSPEGDIVAIHIMTENINDSEEFFKKLLEYILKDKSIKGLKAIKRKGWLKRTVNRIKGVKVATVGIDINPSEKSPYYEQFIEVLTEAKLDGKIILLLIDEFPMTIENIYESHGLQAAKSFLSQNRALRQNHTLSEKVKFIYTGSIGLFHAVKKLNATDRINDLDEIKLPSLGKDKAIALTKALLKSKIGETPKEEAVDYILKKIELWMPLYFQMLVAEIANLANYENLVYHDETTIDRAFDIAAANADKQFQDMKSRLAKLFNPTELKFVNAFLLKLKNSPLDLNETLDLANSKKHPVAKELENIIEILKHDGYIAEVNGSYQFYSPLVKKWWK